MSTSDSSTPMLYKIGRRTSVIAVSAFFATLCISTAVATASAKARLFGFVFNPNGDAINGATVTLASTENGESHIAHTAANGQFDIRDIIPGTYKLTIAARGFDTIDIPNVVVRAGDNNRIDQTLSMVPSGEEEYTVITGGMSGTVLTTTNPLVAAARDDDLEKVKTLLLSKPDVNARDNSSHYTALAGANVNARDKEGKTALMYATGENSQSVIRLLKAHGAIEFEAPEKQ